VRRRTKRFDDMSVETEKLRLWLVEWSTDRMLNGSDSEELPRHWTPASTSGRSLKSAKPGQIYLLSPETAALARRLRYMAILDRRSDGAIMMAPFSRFGVPATQGELRTGRREMHLRVLCLWNARWIRKVCLPAGWHVANMGRCLLASAMNVHHAFTEDAPVSCDLKDLIGPSLKHPLDPRHEYIAEEKHWLDEYLERPLIKESLQYVYPSTEILSMAAESRARYGGGIAGKRSAKKKSRR